MSEADLSGNHCSIVFTSLSLWLSYSITEHAQSSTRSRAWQDDLIAMANGSSAPGSCDVPRDWKYFFIPPQASGMLKRVAVRVFPRDLTKEPPCFRNTAMYCSEKRFSNNSIHVQRELMWYKGVMQVNYLFLYISLGPRFHQLYKEAT